MYKRQVLGTRVTRESSMAKLFATESAQRVVDAAVQMWGGLGAVSYTHLRAHETVLDLVCRLLLEKKKQKQHLDTRL